MGSLIFSTLIALVCVGPIKPDKGYGILTKNFIPGVAWGTPADECLAKIKSDRLKPKAYKKGGEISYRLPQQESEVRLFFDKGLSEVTITTEFEQGRESVALNHFNRMATHINESIGGSLGDKKSDGELILMRWRSKSSDAVLYFFTKMNKVSAHFTRSRS